MELNEIFEKLNGQKVNFSTFDGYEKCLNVSTDKVALRVYQADEEYGNINQLLITYPNGETKVFRLVEDEDLSALYN